MWTARSTSNAAVSMPSSGSIRQAVPGVRLIGGGAAQSQGTGAVHPDAGGHRPSLREDASTPEDFHRALYRQGYIFGSDPNRKYATIRARDGGRAVRLYRLGEEYDLPAIDDRLRGNYLLYGPRLYELKHPPQQYMPKRYRPQNTYAGKGILQLFFEVFFGNPRCAACICTTVISWVSCPRNSSPASTARSWSASGKNTEKILAEHAFVHDHKFPSLQAIADYRKDLSQQIENLTAQRAEVVKQMRRKDAPPELADQRMILTLPNRQTAQRG